jgi:formylglycine-generating enzyme required for sulfatase activity
MEWCLNEHGNPKNTRIQGWTRRVVRGGSWDGSEGLTSAIFRLWDFPERWDNNIGFRLCRP